MGGSASVASPPINKDPLPTESLQGLHNLNWAFAQRSKDLSSLSDNDIQRLAQAILDAGNLDKGSVVEEINSIQSYLNRLKEAVLDVPVPATGAESKVDDDHPPTKVAEDKDLIPKEAAFKSVQSGFRWQDVPICRVAGIPLAFSEATPRG